MNKTLELERLSMLWGGCIKCPIGLWAGRHVFHKGPADAKVMFIGEAPNKSEDFLGQPFVGRAGHLLNKAIASAGGNHKHCLFTNLLACRPSNLRGAPNRAPDDDEVENCSPRLIETIRIVGPRVVVWLGRSAQDWSHLYPTPSAVAFHLAAPSWLLRVGGEKSDHYRRYVDRLKEVFLYAVEG